MAIYSISDLHLSFGMNKPMSVFGEQWDGYEERLHKNWESIVQPDDIVVLPGDFSWGMHLPETVADFQFLESLPGIKILSKGNHDYWWETANKLEGFVREQNLKTIRFLHNNTFLIDQTAICGTKGWAMTLEGPEDERLYRREMIRLKLSLDEAQKSGAEEILLFLHYPPFLKTGVEHEAFFELLEQYPIKTCAYGHLHGYGGQHAYKGDKNGVTFLPVSCDLVDFSPVLIKI